jgi:hypothetical protein
MRKLIKRSEKSKALRMTLPNKEGRKEVGLDSNDLLICRISHKDSPPNNFQALITYSDNQKKKQARNHDSDFFYSIKMKSITTKRLL